MIFKNLGQSLELRKYSIPCEVLWATCVRNSPIFHTDSELAHSWLTGKEVEQKKLCDSP